MQVFNRTTVVTQFILVGFSSLQELQLLLFVIFLFLYLTILMANATIMAVIRYSRTLHTPMYGFLFILSLSESCYTFVIIPQLLVHLLSATKTISFMACATQLFFFLGFACTNCFLIAVMGYDRYVAICHPLRYTLIMNKRLGLGLVSLSGVTGFLIALVATNLIRDMPFCGPNRVNHYFCDMAPVIKLACTDTHVKELALFSLSILVIMVPFLSILISYGFIVNTILKIPSAEGKRKAFATCASHLTVVFVHYGCASIIYLRPKSKSASDKDQLVAVTYTVVTPLLNPLVYSLRNQEVKTALKRVLGMPMATKVA
ncbi:olfactory receptor 10T2 [Camelus ferus]|uniref:Olfactory receptor n=1 Tax=Camelus ferus TaxID=419612 RepID=S9XQ44_CAMFR|nr:olfactory receptor 10T2 [Camelus ferus]EPY90208.1 olfactory receptor 10T2-like protein [Camelus ferus]